MRLLVNRPTTMFNMRMRNLFCVALAIAAFLAPATAQAEEWEYLECIEPAPLEWLWIAPVYDGGQLPAMDLCTTWPWRTCGEDFDEQVKTCLDIVWDITDCPLYDLTACDYVICANEKYDSKSCRITPDTKSCYMIEECLDWSKKNP